MPAFAMQLRRGTTAEHSTFTGLVVILLVLNLLIEVNFDITQFNFYDL